MAQHYRNIFMSSYDEWLVLCKPPLRIATEYGFTFGHNRNIVLDVKYWILCVSYTEGDF